MAVITTTVTVNARQTSSGDILVDASEFIASGGGIIPVRSSPMTAERRVLFAEAGIIQ